MKCYDCQNEPMNSSVGHFCTECLDAWKQIFDDVRRQNNMTKDELTDEIDGKMATMRDEMNAILSHLDVMRELVRLAENRYDNMDAVFMELQSLHSLVQKTS